VFSPLVWDGFWGRGDRLTSNKWSVDMLNINTKSVEESGLSLSQMVSYLSHHGWLQAQGHNFPAPMLKSFYCDYLNGFARL
jgi:hypothetical protein